MHHYKFQLIPGIFILFILFFASSCVTEVDLSIDESIIIDWNLIDYDQINKKLFIKLNIENDIEVINNVSVNIYGESFPIDTTVILNDVGNNGDLISQNNIYSAEIDIELNFQSYVFTAIVQNITLDEYFKLKNVIIEEQVPPEIVNITFIKKYIYESEIDTINPENDFYKVSDLDTSYLYFSVEVKDPNGLEDLRYVRYQVNVQEMVANDSCGYEAPLGYQNESAWYLEYKSKTDSTYIFDVINKFVVDIDDNEIPGLLIKPISVCGRWGTSKFKFIVADNLFAPIISEPISLVFEK